MDPSTVLRHKVNALLDTTTGRVKGVTAGTLIEHLKANNIQLGIPDQSAGVLICEQRRCSNGLSFIGAVRTADTTVRHGPGLLFGAHGNLVLFGHWHEGTLRDTYDYDERRSNK